ncbi:cysteine desulfurase family protein [Streptococcus didelphis]|uniref:cysteine desulfurase family protein n=1 Tax=Streptococcus didelphis TaxID=102886 RepID=UPI00036F04EB|nr:cysteine desulfurase family protein [Streptococcus didelphis]
MKNKNHVYFDNAATTSLTEPVIKVMTETMGSIFGNPSSVHFFGRQASQLLRDCRQTIAQSLNVPGQHIIFTSGGTESNNTAIKGYALANQTKGKHIITTTIEHHSVLNTVAYLEKNFDFEVTYIKPKNGLISAQEIKEALRTDTILVSVMAANNETGDLLPIEEIGQMLKNHQAVFHVDAVQIIGKLPFYPQSLGIDLLSASGHKFHGPKGVGFLYSNAITFDPLLHGGDQEEKRRASTENLIGIVGMSQALKDAYENMDDNNKLIQKMYDALLGHLEGMDYYLNKNLDSLPNVVNIGFPGLQNDILLTRLDLEGIAVSTGSACTAGTVEPSHVLESYFGKDSSRLKESIRISFSELNTLEEILLLTKHLKKIIGGSNGI